MMTEKAQIRIYYLPPCKKIINNYGKFSLKLYIGLFSSEDAKFTKYPASVIF